MPFAQQVRPGQLAAVPAAVTPAFDISELLTSIMPLIMLMMVMMMIMPMMKGMAEAFKSAT
jgi:hypothetical protein